MTIQSLIVTIGSGGLVGFALGLLGGGGSILATPLLLYVVGVTNPHIAIGTSAVAVSANAYANLIAHAWKGHVWWRSAVIFALVGTLGAFLGSSIGMLIDGQRLLFLFGLLMAMVGLLMLRGRATAPHAEQHQTVLRMCMKTSAVAILTGAASGFFGIGGGFLIVPALIFATKMPTINAIGSSLLAVGTFGLITTLNYARHDLVDWTIAMEFIVGGITGGGLGTLLATRFSASKHLLNRVFGLIVIAVAIYVIWRSWASLVA
ncbi:sulfite exporter TauE/SafE family protein [Xylella fastidiosa]|uniref:sulfite exporter TauE/SafE family protein n=1 Tax=Xylella fastidiosa TaxID=2371 RepID=UPI0009835B2C|nr:sulfite exporter TauE/SafE family protein [Xylella fastidiosa]ALR09566.2 hypothetical protein XFFB_10635 [Xylella fastidiosa]WGZ34093.1 sulfite exporter TauE/SafE family protein [Xylella fastidiosa subsp. pauca]WGZ36401.1 sulfite exporter TauE/SafE family protein [Xylella fastidiosa subsp. pauca]